MNIYGCNLSALKRALGSKDAVVLEKAVTLLSQSLKEPALSKGIAWLRTLIENGFPLQQDRQSPSEPDDGSLLTFQMETEPHVFAVYALARAIGGSEFLDLSEQTSQWAHPVVGALSRELAACGFRPPRESNVQFISWKSRLGNGSPLFGDGFHTPWSFYSVFDNEELQAMIPVLRSAVEYKRSLPESYSEEFRKRMVTGLSGDAKNFALDLITWFGRIQSEGQDALVLWW